MDSFTSDFLDLKHWEPGSNSMALYQGISPLVEEYSHLEYQPTCIGGRYAAEQLGSRIDQSYAVDNIQAIEAPHRKDCDYGPFYSSSSTDTLAFSNHVYQGKEAIANGQLPPDYCMVQSEYQTTGVVCKDFTYSGSSEFVRLESRLSSQSGYSTDCSDSIHGGNILRNCLETGHKKDVDNFEASSCKYATKQNFNDFDGITSDPGYSNWAALKGIDAYSELSAKQYYMDTCAHSEMTFVEQLESSDKVSSSTDKKEAKKDRRRKQNRVAAKRCREKKKKQLSELWQDYQRLESAHDELSERLLKALQDKQKLEDVLKKHQKMCNFRTVLHGE